MSDEYTKIIEMIPKLKEEELDLLRDRIGAKRKIRADYTSTVSAVKLRLEEHGVITAREAHDLGYTDSVLPSSTFRRCVIDKVGLDIAIEKTARDIGGTENLYYVKGMRDGFESLGTVELVAHDIVKRIDTSQPSHDLFPHFDNRKYPILKKTSNLAPLRKELIRAMARAGYESVSSRLDFRRYA